MLLQASDFSIVGRFMLEDLPPAFFRSARDHDGRECDPSMKTKCCGFRGLTGTLVSIKNLIVPELSWLLLHGSAENS